jgi:hypothetical protein
VQFTSKNTHSIIDIYKRNHVDWISFYLQRSKELSPTVKSTTQESITYYQEMKVNSLDHIISNRRMILNEKLIGKNAKGKICDLIRGALWHVIDGIEENN